MYLSSLLVPLIKKYFGSSLCIADRYRKLVQLCPLRTTLTHSTKKDFEFCNSFRIQNGGCIEAVLCFGDCTLVLPMITEGTKNSIKMALVFENKLV